MEGDDQSAELTIAATVAAAVAIKSDKSQEAYRKSRQDTDHHLIVTDTFERTAPNPTSPSLHYCLVSVQ